MTVMRAATPALARPALAVALALGRRLLEKMVAGADLVVEEARLGVDPVLDPVPWSQAVSRYSMAKGLWKHVADALIAKEPALRASSTTGKAVAHAA